MCCVDLQSSINPLFEVRFELEDGDTSFYPSLVYGIADGFYDLVESLIQDVYKVSELVPRISMTNRTCYDVSTTLCVCVRLNVTYVCIPF